MGARDGIEGEVDDFILEDVFHCCPSFLKTRGIALCPWHQERFFCTLHGGEDPKNNRLRWGEMPPKLVSSPARVPSSQRHPTLGSTTICGPKRSQLGSLAMPVNSRPSCLGAPTPIVPELLTWKRGVPASPKPSKIPLPPPHPAPLHALPQLVLCNEGKGKKKKKKTKGTEGEGATSAWAVGSQDERCGWGGRGRVQGL